MTGFVAGPRLGTGLAPRRHAVWFPAQKLTLLTKRIQLPSSGYARGGTARLDSGTGAVGAGGHPSPSGARAHISILSVLSNKLFLHDSQPMLEPSCGRFVGVACQARILLSGGIMWDDLHKKWKRTF